MQESLLRRRSALARKPNEHATSRDRILARVPSSSSRTPSLLRAVDGGDRHFLARPAVQESLLRRRSALARKPNEHASSQDPSHPSPVRELRPHGLLRYGVADDGGGHRSGSAYTAFP